MMMQQDADETVTYNSIINRVGGLQTCIYQKHVVFASDGLVVGNYCMVQPLPGGNMETVGILSSGALNRQMRRNLVAADVGVALRDSGGPTYWGGAVFENNTFIAQQAVRTSFDWRWNTDGSTAPYDGTNASDECGGDAPFGAPLIFRRNITQSRQASFLAQELGTYESDATYDKFFGASRMWQSDNNGFYSTGSKTLRMGVMISNTGCTEYCCSEGKLGHEYSGLPAIQAAGYEAGSFYANPLFSGNSYIPGNAVMAQWGYMSPAGSPPIQAPYGLTATANSRSMITVRWSDRSTNEQGFRIERRIGAGAWMQVGEVGANVTTYANTGLIAGTTYAYRVLAYNASGISGYSNEASATTLGGPVARPSAPTNLIARAASRNQVNLTWRDTSSDEQGFRIERKTGTGAWVQIVEVGANSASFANSGLRPNTTYRYRVRAFNAGGTSAYATSTAVKTPR
jgi:hypothetical protein